MPLQWHWNWPLSSESGLGRYIWPDQSFSFWKVRISWYNFSYWGFDPLSGKYTFLRKGKFIQYKSRFPDKCAGVSTDQVAAALSVYKRDDNLLKSMCWVCISSSPRLVAIHTHRQFLTLLSNRYFVLLGYSFAVLYSAASFFSSLHIDVWFRRLLWLRLSLSLGVSPPTQVNCSI